MTPRKVLLSRNLHTCPNSKYRALAVKAVNVAACSLEEHNFVLGKILIRIQNHHQSWISILIDFVRDQATDGIRT